MYIVTILGIIISFCLRLSILFRLRYYGYYYYEKDSHARAVSLKQTGLNSCLISDMKMNLIWCHIRQVFLTAFESVMTTFALCVSGILMYLSTIARLALKSTGTQVNPALLP